MSTNVAPVKNDQAGLLEKLLFSYRSTFIFACLVLTLFLAWQVSHLKPDASFEKMIPKNHPFIINMLDNIDDLKGSGNALQIAVESKQGDIFNAEYLDVLRQITDEVFYLPGVERSGLKSLWTPNVRWLAVTEEGFDGGTVIPNGYNGSAGSVEKLKNNAMNSGEVGRLIANDFRSTIIYAPLLERDPNTGEPLDYQRLSVELEQKIRDKFNSASIDIHIIGFAKKIGDLLEGIASIGFFALLTIIVTLLLLFNYSRCMRSTIAPIVCSLIAVVWQMGLLTWLGYGLNAYSVLVPFLVFAIAVSHGVQVVNAVSLVGISENTDKFDSAKLAFRQLYVAGMIALVSDVMGFLTLLFIDIGVIRDLAIAASLGVMIIIVTNLFLLPLIMSYTGVGKISIARKIAKSEQNSKLWTTLSHCVQPKVAFTIVAFSILLALFGLIEGQNLKIGDLDKGAPELRADSRYNLDNSYIVDHYSSSSDVFVILAKTEKEQCVSYDIVDAQDRLQWQLKQTPGVQSTISLSTVAKKIIMGMNEGAMKWYELSREQAVLNTALSGNMPEALMNKSCSMVPVIVFLDDHKAETLQAVVKATQAFIAADSTPGLTWLMAAGNAGIEAATNEVIDASENQMLFFVYAVVSFLVLITFRSIAAVFCIMLPLALTTVLCQALMANLGIGVKVATLPVMAMGVGVGVDYSIYIFSRMKTYLASGHDLEHAYHKTLQTTGKAVSFTGITLAIGVSTWIFSPIKFQADMGILLTFMFLFNMIGALCLMPALVHFFFGGKLIVKKQIPQTHINVDGTVRKEIPPVEVAIAQNKLRTEDSTSCL